MAWISNAPAILDSRAVISGKTGAGMELAATLTLLLSTLILAAHFLATSHVSFLAFPWLALVALVSFFLAPPLALCLLLFALFFQNSFIALFQPLLQNSQQFSILQGSSFLLASLMALCSAIFFLKNHEKLPATALKLFQFSWLLIGIVMLYAFLGAMNATPMSALTYVRLYLIGPFLLVIGLVFGFVVPTPFLISVLRIITALLVFWGICEFTLTTELYGFFHVADYLNFKFANRHDATLFSSVSEAIDASTRPFLNITGAFDHSFMMLRLNGPNLHPISYAYSLAACALFGFIFRLPVLACLASLFTFLVGAKGPALMLVLTFGLALFYRLFPARKLLAPLLLGAVFFYLAFGISYGLYTRDYHVIGFLGGVQGFLANPIGRGIGVGGNLSGLGFQETDWQAFQNFGASFARESAVGVMLYQIGLASLVFALFCGRFWKATWQAAFIPSAHPRLIALPLAFVFLAVNAVFQEEALSPAGWGLMLFFAGFILAKGWAIRPSADNATSHTPTPHALAPHSS